MVGDSCEPVYCNITSSKTVTRGEVLNHSVDPCYYGNTPCIETSEDRVRVLRVIEYEGPRSVVERTVKKSIKGEVTYGDITIRAATIGEFPTILTKGNNEDVRLAPDVLTMEKQDENC